MIELLCETDFVAKNADFQTLADRIVAAADVQAISDRDVLLAASLDDGTTVSSAIDGLAGVIGEKLELGRVGRFDGEVAVYLPQGSWLRFPDGGAPFAGGGVLRLTLALGEMAVFARAGAAIPLGPALQRIPDGAGPPAVESVWTGS